MKSCKISMIFVLVAAFLAATITLGGGNARASTSARSMIVIERDSGLVLDSYNAEQTLPMASTTKIVTAITVIDNCSDLDKCVTVPDAAVGVEGSSIYLQKGERLTIKQLLYGLMLRSGNDCAVALAVSVAGSVENFAKLMNETAVRCNATNSNFVNPHGLHDKNHYTTASDLAKISAYAMKNETFAQIVGTKRVNIPWANHDYDRELYNKNKILTMLDGGNGIKTGYTTVAGRCLVASAQRNGVCIVAVVLDCRPMFEDCCKLINDAFVKYENKKKEIEQLQPIL